MAITDGYVIITGASGTTEYDTHACPHCGGHFIIIPGSGRVRAFCQLCHAPICDKAKCLEHSPFAKRLDLVEAGKLPLERL
mgnify:CR=1 FL=1